MMKSPDASEGQMPDVLEWLDSERNRKPQNLRAVRAA
jgi:hypothetical protein